MGGYSYIAAEAGPATESSRVTSIWTYGVPLVTLTEDGDREAPVICGATPAGAANHSPVCTAAHGSHKNGLVNQKKKCRMGRQEKVSFRNSENYLGHGFVCPAPAPPAVKRSPQRLPTPENGRITPDAEQPGAGHAESGYPGAALMEGPAAIPRG